MLDKHLRLFSFVCVRIAAPVTPLSAIFQGGEGGNRASNSSSRRSSRVPPVAGKHDGSSANFLHSLLASPAELCQGTRDYVYCHLTLSGLVCIFTV